MDENEIREASSFCTTVLYPEYLKLNKVGKTPKILYAGMELYTKLTRLYENMQITEVEKPPKDPPPMLGNVELKWDGDLDPDKWEWDVNKENDDGKSKRTSINNQAEDTP